MSLTPLKYFESLYPKETREKEIHEYLSFLKRGLSAQIIGIPGSGKSNILRLLAFNKDARTHHFKTYENVMHFVYMDASEVKDRSQFDITKFILYSLAFSLGERQMMEESKHINSLLKDAISLQDELLLFQALKQSLDYLSIEKKLSVVFLFDKFDVLIPTISPIFFTNLRILRNNAKYRFGAIFSLTRPFDETLDIKVLSDFHDLVSGNEIYISLFDPIGINFRLDYIEKASRNRMELATRQKIIDLTAGHAKLTKLSFEAAVEEDEDIDDLEEFLLNRSVIQGALFEIWNSLTPSEQYALKNNVSFDEIEKNHPYLVKANLYNRNGITIPLFKSYISSASRTTGKKIVYDEERNEILLDDKPITDRLSSSEFRLLLYLIQNQEKVCTKDELINAIWSDQQSQEGVTDQALDQIFYRLRKKIEENPSQPQHILTLKGRGYKLTNETH